MTKKITGRASAQGHSGNDRFAAGCRKALLALAIVASAVPIHAAVINEDGADSDNNVEGGEDATFNSGTISTGTLFAAGYTANSITTGTLATTGNATVGGNLTVTGDLTVNGTLIFDTVNTNTITTGVLTVSGTISTGTLLTTDLTATGSITGDTITGNTLTDGTLSINGGAITGATDITASGEISAGTISTGTLTTTGNASVGGTLGVVSNASIGGTFTVAGASAFNSSVNVDSNGAAEGGGQLAVTDTAVSLTVTNTATGNAHGLTVSQTETVLSGGTTSTTLTLNDNGATFTNTLTGGPAVVTGIADGVGDYDAVNMRQFRELETDVYGGIAASMAMAAVPDIDNGKNFSVGVGTAVYEGEQAIAVGANARFSEAWRVRITASQGATSAVSAGTSFSW